MLVQIKCLRLFASFFSKVVTRSITNVFPYQVFKTLCWFFFHKLLLGREPMLVQIKGSRLFAGFFSKVFARSITNVCLYQVFKTLCWVFLEVVARSITNACPD
jgi:hypothetical protein